MAVGRRQIGQKKGPNNRALCTVIWEGIAGINIKVWCLRCMSSVGVRFGGRNWGHVVRRATQQKGLTRLIDNPLEGAVPTPCSVRSKMMGEIVWRGQKNHIWQKQNYDDENNWSG